MYPTLKVNSEKKKSTYIGLYSGNLFYVGTIETHY